MNRVTNDVPKEKRKGQLVQSNIHIQVQRGVVSDVSDVVERFVGRTRN